MLIRPSRKEAVAIVQHLGGLTLVLAAMVGVSALVSVLAGETGPALRLGTGALQILLLGLLLSPRSGAADPVSTGGAFALVALFWVWSMALIAWVYLQTGHFLSYLDACFDAMSGFTTTGLVLMQDLDHAPEGLQFLRHLITFVGGQGIIALFLAVLAKDSPVFFQLYVGEGKDERLWPNVLHTARAIWKISVLALLLGMALLFPVLKTIGLSTWRAFFDGLYLFEGAWSTGGFAPHSQNLLYYHSLAVDLATVLLFTIGSFNFFIHYQVSLGRVRELWENSEVRTFFLSVTLLTLLLGSFGVGTAAFPTAETAFRRGFYQVISAHTTTGNMNLFARQFVHEWPVLAVLVLVAAMAVGGSACSTAGGIKGIRVALMLKGVWFEIKRFLIPDSAVTVVRYHHGEDRLVTPAVAARAFLIGMLFMGMFVGTFLAGVVAGYPLLDSLFDGVSAASNSGLSIGLTSVAMPGWLKAVYIVAMWLGRLEFMAALILGGYVLAWGVGK